MTGPPRQGGPSRRWNGSSLTAFAVLVPAFPAEFLHRLDRLPSPGRARMHIDLRRGDRLMPEDSLDDVDRRTELAKLIVNSDEMAKRS